MSEEKEMEHVYVTAPRYDDFFTGFLYDYTNPGLDYINGYRGGLIRLIAVATDSSGNVTVSSKEGCKQSFDPNEYTDSEKGLLLKLIDEGSDDPKIKELYEYCAANNIKIVYHNDGLIHDKSGLAFEWDSVIGAKDKAGVISSDYKSNGKPEPGTTIHISTNPTAIDAATRDGIDSEQSLQLLGKIIVHELGHAWADDTNTPAIGEAEFLDEIVPSMIDNIFKNDDGTWEDDWSEIYESGKAIGTFGNDIITGSTEGYNMLEGGLGDDVITGGNKSDYIDGGEGSDTLYGLGGDDVLIAGATTGTDEILYGGTGNDNYIIDSYGQARTISDSQGIDTLHLETDASATYFHNLDNDSMVVIGSDTYNIVVITDWSTSGQVENITFSDDSSQTYQEINSLAIDQTMIPTDFWV